MPADRAETARRRAEEPALLAALLPSSLQKYSRRRHLREAQVHPGADGARHRKPATPQHA